MAHEDAKTRRGAGDGRYRWAALVVVGALGVAVATRPAAAQSPGATAADSAWERKDYDAAARLYGERLAADSSDAVALHRLGLILAWGEKYDRGLELLDRLVAERPEDAAAGVDRARVLAWKHDLKSARAGVDAVLAKHPGDMGALRLRAQVESWSGDYDASLTTYKELLAGAPGDRSIQQERARVLGWTTHYGAAADAYRQLLENDSTDLEARLGLARVLSWSQRLDSAAVVFASVLRQDPANLEAERGLARMASWRGRLAAGEAGWRQVLAHEPDDVEALVGLGQTLRWQGRHAEALEVLEKARRLAPTDADVRTQWEWARAAGAPRVTPFLVYERDSDGNRIATSRIVMAWNPLPRVALRADGYIRRLEQALIVGQPDRSARGFLLSADVLAGAGWTFTAGGGAAGSDAPDAAPRGQLLASLQSPSSAAVSGGASFSRTALDATARLAETGVMVNEASLSGGTAPSAAWSLRARGAIAEFDGTETNRRTLGQLEVARRVASWGRLMGSVTGFGFDHASTDGYFSPDFYGLAELGARWLRDNGRWSAVAEVAPGVQKIGEHGKAGGTFRVSGRLGYSVAPGRQVGVALGYSTTGLQSLAPGAAGYRYTSAVLSAGWAF
ncbi:MAG TPA: tetratricopeptide repeat protein [Longimicrobiales bacterium]|nr:tetratricopeptide repeat protein [Longimicrobiales bacterium]